MRGPVSGLWPGGALRLRILGAALLAFLAAPVRAQDAADLCVGSARYLEPTTRYDHGILGDDVEWGALEIVAGPCTDPSAAQTSHLLRLPDTMVFEDIAPRIVDADGDGRTEVLVIETDLSLGARLALYDAQARQLATTPHFGQRNRWYSPVGQGVGDLDGDGRPEIAFVDRPHLAKVLQVWRYDGETMVPVASLDGVTNHRIGEDYITGDIRSCGGQDEAIVVSADWSRLLSVTMQGGRLIPRDIGPFQGRANAEAALTC